MSYVIPSDAHSANDTGHVSDHNNVSDVLTALANSILLLYAEPSGATAATFSRFFANTATSALVSGTLYVTAIGMHQNTTVNNLTFCTKSTAETGGTHAWYVLLDSSLVVRAVTADQTGATALTSTNTPYTFATNSYVTTYSGLYYVGICVVATGMPTMASPGLVASGAASATPVLAGTSSTAQTTPPAVGATMGALTSAAGFALYSYTS